MSNLSNNLNCLLCDKELNRLINYLIQSNNEEPFIMKQIDDDNRYYLKQSIDGYNLISLANDIPIICCEDINNNGYKRYRYNSHNVLAHRLIYKMYGYIPDYINFDDMEIHHKNLDKMDNRLDNLYLISVPNHRILHKYIDKYGIENV